jgi:hypothetical protein
MVTKLESFEFHEGWIMVIRGRPAFRCKHRWFGSSSRCRPVWSVRTLSARRGICESPVGDLTGLSQYPVFKVQAQRGVTLRTSLSTVNSHFRPIQIPSIRRRQTRTPPIDRRRRWRRRASLCDTRANLYGHLRANAQFQDCAPLGSESRPQGARDRIAPGRGARNKESHS